MNGPMPWPNDHQLDELIHRAKQVCWQAYCPYSTFRVGAAILTNTGQMFTGCNVENASYGLTICAERNAIFNMVTSLGVHAPTSLVAVVIYTPTQTPSAPCGACRQVLNEFISPNVDVDVICVCDGSAQIKTKLSKLFPQAFGPANLNS
jgi:cytidine deaminase